MIRESPDGKGVLVDIKVVPGASRTRLLGALGDRLKIAVSAPPEKGKANQAVISFFAKSVGVRRSDVRVISGLTSAGKTIRIDGVPSQKVRALLIPERS